MRTRHAAALVATVLLLAACSAEVHGVASPARTPAPDPPSSSSTPAPSPAPEAPPGGTADESGPAKPGATDDSADSVQVTGLRYDSDDSSARLVVTLSGSGVPEWTVGYSAAAGPDGAPVDIAGDAFLRVRVRSGAVGGGGDQGSSRFSISPGPVAEARTLGVAGGYEEVLIGVRGGKQPFTVEPQTDPGRLVVRVRATG